MNTFGHIEVAKAVYSYLEKKNGIKLNKAGFVWGNIVPDFCIDVVANPHYIENYFDFIKSEIAELSSRITRSETDFDFAYSRRLGIVCHYCTDFFCFVHNKEFTGSSFRHVQYEHKLSKYCKHHRDILKNVDFVPNKELISGSEAICDNLLKLHKRFIASKRHYSTDFMGSVRACCESMVYIITTALAASSAVSLVS